MRSLILEAHHNITSQLVEQLTHLNMSDVTVINDLSQFDYKAAHDYQMIFIDYSINHEDPFEIAFQLKNANPNTYIVFLTRF